MKAVKELLEIVAKLRSPEGCPWDQAQTHQSMRRELVEECYELLETLDSLDDRAMQEELGDVLLQVVFHAQLGQERQAFDFEAIVKTLSEKLVRRHPHVFGDQKAQNVEQAWDHWDAAKKKEKSADQSVLAGVTKALPALMYAQKIQKKAAKIGFDWERQAGVFEKVDEELAELREAVEKQEGVEEELGDLFFTLAVLARHLKLDAEQALRLSVEKFTRRFEWMEQYLQKQGKKIESLSKPEMEDLWQKAKQALKKQTQAQASGV